MDILHHFFGSVGNGVVIINMVVVHLMMEYDTLVLFENLKISLDKVDVY